MARAPGSPASIRTAGAIRGAFPAKRSRLIDRQFVPTVFLYDNYAGGIGPSTPLFELRDEIIARTIALVQDCGCHSGSPACVGPILASDESRGYAPKQAGLTVLKLISLSNSHGRQSQTLEALEADRP